MCKFKPTVLTQANVQAQAKIQSLVNVLAEAKVLSQASVRARKIRAHSRILRLEREVLRPENLMQSQFCAWNPKTRRIIATRWTYFATRFGKQRIRNSLSFLTRTKESDVSPAGWLWLQLGVDRKLSTCASIKRSAGFVVWPVPKVPGPLRLTLALPDPSIDDPTCSRTSERL